MEIMQIQYAKAIAQQWLEQHATNLTGFVGAVLHGSVAYLPDDAILAATSDVDVLLVLDGPLPASKPGKFRYQGVLLEVSLLALREVQTPELILGSSHLAGSFRMPGILADPTGKLADLHHVVVRDFAKWEWVLKRCEHVQQKIHNNLAGIQKASQLHDQVSAWLFATGLTTHIILVAALQNPTVRQRYLAARTVLQAYGQLGFYQQLLELLGCASMNQQRAAQHMAALTNVFDITDRYLKTAYLFAADLSAEARPVAIDGSRQLIEQGLQHEAVFWMLATYARCMSVLYRDAPTDVQDQHMPGFLALLSDVGIASVADMQQRGEQLVAFLPALMHIAEGLMRAHPEITEKPLVMGQ
jgi:hypothetical protein